MASPARSTDPKPHLRRSAPDRSTLDPSMPKVPPKGGFWMAIHSAVRSLRYGVEGGPFLALLRSQVQLVSEAAALLSVRIEPGAQRDVVRQYAALRGSLFELERSLTEDLCQRPIAPLPHEDIRALSVGLNKIMQSLAETAALPLELPRSSELEVFEASNSCMKAVQRGIAALPASKRIMAETPEIAASARKAEILLRACEAEMAAGESDPVRLLKRRHAITATRSLFRCYVGIARALEYAALKIG